jgi:hypothetical protein
MSLHTDIVIPWVNADAHAPHDLKYTLRSINQMWKGLYRVVLIGDKPTHLTGFKHLPMERTNDAHLPRALDAVRKIQAAIDCKEIQQRFVWTYDDIIFLRPVGMDDLTLRVGMYELTPDHMGYGSGGHRQAMRKTYQALKDRGLRRVYNYETHMPRVYEKRRLQEIIDIYRPASNRLLIPTLYFNHFHPNEEPILMKDRPDLLARFVGESRSPYDIPPAPTTDNERAIPWYLEQLRGKRMLNWNNSGMRVGLQYTRHKLFPDESEHEPQ